MANYDIGQMIIWAVIFVLVWKIIDWLIYFVRKPFSRHERHHRGFGLNRTLRYGWFKIIIILVIIYAGYFAYSEGYFNKILNFFPSNKDVEINMNTKCSELESYKAISQFFGLESKIDWGKMIEIDCRNLCEKNQTIYKRWKCPDETNRLTCVCKQPN